MTKKGRQFLGKNRVTPSVAAPVTLYASAYWGRHLLVAEAIKIIQHAYMQDTHVLKV